MTVHYEPFEIEVGEATGEAHPITASFQGGSWQAHLPVRLPMLTSGEIERALEWLERGFIDREYARDFGNRLFRSLFTGSVLAGFRESYQRAESEGTRLRIVLTLPSSLARLPWELMYDEDGGDGFIARSLSAPLVRHMKGLPIPNRLPKSGPLRVLVVTASPAGLPHISSQAESQALSERFKLDRGGLKSWLLGVIEGLRNTGSFGELIRLWRGGGPVVLEILNGATRQKLQERIASASRSGQGFHVVHFIGHGGISPQGGELFLEDESGHLDPLSAKDFAEMISCPTLNLLVLNACQTASGVPLFDGVAHAALHRRIPAVIGMQVQMLDQSALNFARFFYTYWAGGEPLEAALSYARRLMSRASAGAAADWGIPVLFMGPIEGLQLALVAELRPRWRKRAWSLLTLLVITLIPTFYFYYGIYTEANPGLPKMTGAFNVAVARIGEQSTPGKRLEETPDSQYLSTQIANAITPLAIQGNERYMQVADLSVMVQGSTPEERERAAQRLAEQVNATVLVYGVMDVSGPNYLLYPEVYLSEQLADARELTQATQDDTGKLERSGELVGMGRFGAPVHFYKPLTNNPENSSSLTGKLEPRLAALNQFLVGIIYFRLDQPDIAVGYLEQALTTLDSEGQSNQAIIRQGREVIDLFLGAALIERQEPGDLERARQVYQSALDLSDQQYARAYLGLGNLARAESAAQGMLSSELMEQAILNFREAISATIKPQGAYVDAKAYFNMGMTQVDLARFAWGDCPDPAAMQSLSLAITEFKQDPGAPSLQEIGAKAHYQIGLLQEACANERLRSGQQNAALDLYLQAHDQYSQTISLAEPPQVQVSGWLHWLFTPTRTERHEQPWHRLRWEAYNRLAVTCLAQAQLENSQDYSEAQRYLQKVIQIFTTSPDDVLPEIAAEVYFNLGYTYEAQGQIEAAVTAYQRVLDLMPPNSELMLRAEERLNSLNPHGS
jgi:tetratricopeptide (TPR) repeat protein